MTNPAPELPGLSQILEGTLDDWVDALPIYQRTHVQTMLRQAGPVAVADQWLRLQGPSDTAPYGGARAAGVSFYQNLLRELRSLFCDPDAYTEERKGLAKATGAGQLFVASTVCTAVAPHVGVAAAVIGPAVALTLSVLSNAGKSTICGEIDRIIAQQDKADSGQDIV